VVVGVHAVARQGGEDLVAFMFDGARPGLEDVDRELRVMVAGGHLVARARDRVGELGVELAEVGVRPGRGALDAPEPVDDRGGDRLAGDREVVDGLLRLTAVERLSRSHGQTLATERRKLPRDPDRIVVGHEELRAAEDAQLRVGQQVERLLGRLQDGGDRRRPTAAAPGSQARVEVQQLAARPPASAWRAAPTSARG
jgi:hypothetical protein